VRNFRQASWQWDALHQGRCTTSQAVAALGFLEPMAGDLLGVPKSWRRGGLGAYHRLRKRPLRTLEEMKEELCVGPFDTAVADDRPSNSTTSNPYWKIPRRFPFAAKYMVPISKELQRRRRAQAEVYTESPGFEWSIRCAWGNVQEATALLTALNYFWQQNNNIVLKEVGMCGAGLELGSASHLLVGATPDALLCHPDGTLEAVEVKNHCPFLPNYRVSSQKPSLNRNKKRFRIGRPQLSPGIMPHYVPQLMMEMLCVGKECKSAVMVRQTATNGALILRIQRDDEWIDEMMFWLNRFNSQFVEQGVPPPTNFFLEGSIPVDQARYQEFLEWTKRLESKVEVLSHVPNDMIQRATGTFFGYGNLFLD